MTYDELLQMDERPKPFESYSAQELWDDEHIGDGKAQAAATPRWVRGHSLCPDGWAHTTA